MSIPVIDAITIQGRIEQNLQYLPQATNSPTTWSVSGLPSGLSIDTPTIYGVTGDNSSNIITATGSAYTNGQQVFFQTVTGGSELTSGTIYFVINAIGATFQLAATSGGSAIAFTTAITAGTVSLIGTGLISGSPQVTGTFNCPLTATNSSGDSVAIMLNIVIVGYTPVVSPTTSLIDFPVGERWIFQPTATNAPTSWVWTGLPEGVDYSSVNGSIGGAVLVQGIWIATCKATNANGDSAIVEMPISIYFGAWANLPSQEIKIDAATGALIATTPIALKSDTDLLLAVAFYDESSTANLLALNLGFLQLVVKAYDTDEISIFQTDGTFSVVGDVATRHYQILVSVRGATLPDALAEKNNIAGTAITGIGEFRFVFDQLVAGQPVTFQKITPNFPVTITRNLLAS